MKGIVEFLGEVKIGNIETGTDVVGDVGFPEVALVEDSILAEAIRSGGGKIHLSEYGEGIVNGTTLIAARCLNKVVNFLLGDSERMLGMD